MQHGNIPYGVVEHKNLGGSSGMQARIGDNSRPRKGPTVVGTQLISPAAALKPVPNPNPLATIAGRQRAICANEDDGHSAGLLACLTVMAQAPLLLSNLIQLFSSKSRVPGLGDRDGAQLDM